MNIEINGHWNLATIHSHLSKFIGNNRAPQSSEFLLDMCGLTFIDPSGVTALTNILTYLVRKQCRITVRYPKQLNEAVQFLDDCGFFKMFFGDQLRQSSRCRSTTIPLRRLEYSEYYGWLDGTVLPWLSQCLCFNIGRGWPSFSTVLGEIFNNVNDHAGESAQIASTMMQHFPKNNTVSIAISDFGVGIPDRVRGAVPTVISDDQAILKAVEDNFSTRSTPRNRGAGLDTVIRNTVDFNNGSVQIVSGHGSVFFNQHNRQGVPRLFVVNYPGTLIHLTLRTDTINKEEIYEEDLSW